MTGAAATALILESVCRDYRDRLGLDVRVAGRDVVVVAGDHFHLLMMEAVLAQRVLRELRRRNVPAPMAANALGTVWSLLAAPDLSPRAHHELRARLTVDRWKDPGVPAISAAGDLFCLPSPWSGGKRWVEEPRGPELPPLSLAVTLATAPFGHESGAMPASRLTGRPSG
ncbi:hypothetical protein [Nocardia jejuensis]|uniref:hypothetical protein n=1 Tax=Nocardia jejuensis TaxID=328049 RepID=UPI00082FB939|nr:hypothetical protein [Nocardia jejuensis]